MIKKYLISTLCFILAFSSVNFFPLDASEKGAIEKIHKHKIYLNPKYIHITNNGIFIEIGKQLKIINHLEVDGKGIFCDGRKINAFGESCPVCDLPLIWGFCLNAACPSKE